MWLVKETVAGISAKRAQKGAFVIQQREFVEGFIAGADICRQPLRMSRY